MSSEGQRVSQLSAKRRWLSSERVAHAVLEEMGFRILETRKKLVLSNVEVGEVDLVVEDPATREVYAVEVKAGRLDVSGIRQAYVNAVLAGAKPMVICKGFADDAAKELAEKLGVRVVQLSDVFLVESEELYTIVREVVEEALTDYFEVFYGFEPELKPEQYALLEVIYRTSTIDEAAEKLGIGVQDLARKLEELRRAGVIPKWATKYTSIKRVAQLMVQKRTVASALEEGRKLLDIAKSLGEQLKAIHSTVQDLNKQVSKLSSLLAKLESRATVQEAREQSQQAGG